MLKTFTEGKNDCNKKVQKYIVIAWHFIHKNIVDVERNCRKKINKAQSRLSKKKPNEVRTYFV